MHQKTKTQIIILLFTALLIIPLIKADGCCINPRSPQYCWIDPDWTGSNVLRLTPLDNCCPFPEYNPSYYGAPGPSNDRDCENRFFVSDRSCWAYTDNPLGEEGLDGEIIYPIPKVEPDSRIDECNPENIGCCCGCDAEGNRITKENLYERKCEVLGYSFIKKASEEETCTAACNRAAVCQKPVSPGEEPTPPVEPTEPEEPTPPVEPEVPPVEPDTETPQTCSDDTPYNSCSTTKPKYCQNGVLIDNCQECSCDEEFDCNDDGTCSRVTTPHTEPEQPTCNNNAICEQGEDCSCTDCNGQQNGCEPGKICTGGNCVKCPDFDGDGRVYFPDFLLFQKEYGKQITSPDLAKFDVNDDGVVGFADFMIFADNYRNRCGTATLPDQCASLFDALENPVLEGDESAIALIRSDIDECCEEHPDAPSCVGWNTQ